MFTISVLFNCAEKENLYPQPSKANEYRVVDKNTYFKYNKYLNKP